MPDKEQGSNAMLPPMAAAHIADQIAADELRLAGEQKRVEAQTIHDGEETDLSRSEDVAEP
jgi:hypothetical protein